MSSPGFASPDDDVVVGKNEITATSHYDDDIDSDPMSMDKVLTLVLGPAIALSTTLDDMFFLTAGIDKAREGGADKMQINKWRTTIDDRVKNMVDVIVKSGTDTVLKRCGIREVVAALKEGDGGGAALQGVRIPAHLDEESLKRAIETFNSCLSSPLVPNYENISEVTFRAKARRDTLESILSSYNLVHREVTERGSEFGDVHSWLKYTPEQVKTLIM